MHVILGRLDVGGCAAAAWDGHTMFATCVHKLVLNDEMIVTVIHCACHPERYGS